MSLDFDEVYLLCLSPLVTLRTYLFLRVLLRAPVVDSAVLHACLLLGCFDHFGFLLLSARSMARRKCRELFSRHSRARAFEHGHSVDQEHGVEQ